MKRNLMSSFIVGIIVVLVLSSTYAFLIFTTSQNTNETVAGCFQVNYSGQEIQSEELKSTEQYSDGAQTEIQLWKDEDCDIYTEANLYIHTDTKSTTAPVGKDVALKYQVVQVLNTGQEKVVDGAAGSINPDGNGDLLIHTVHLTNDIQTYKVYLWIDSNISLGSYDNTSYQGYIYATSTQTSTVTKNT